MPITAPLLLLVLLLAGGCSRVPKIIVLEDPLTAAEHVDLGVAYERKGNLDLAEREYGKALRKEGGHLQARINLGNVHLARKEYGKARKEYLRALDLSPGNAEAANNLAWASIFSGNGLEDSLRRLEAAVAATPDVSATLLDTLGVLHTRLGHPMEAERAFSGAEAACRAPVPAGGQPCSEDVRREIGEHREELRRLFPPAAGEPALVR